MLKSNLILDFHFNHFFIQKICFQFITNCKQSLHQNRYWSSDPADFLHVGSQDSPLSILRLKKRWKKIFFRSFLSRAARLRVFGKMRKSKITMPKLLSDMQPIMPPCICQNTRVSEVFFCINCTGWWISLLCAV